MNAQVLQLDLLQPLFESATNAAQKGQQQYPTPVDFAKEIAAHLPECRKTICDLTCGNGSLLLGTANETTRHLLGCDIEKLPVRNSRFATTNFQADLTLLYPLLKEIEWRCELFALNPPWDLHWHRDRLKCLAQSEVPAVRAAFSNRDPRLGAETIDSTIATFLIALDRCTYRGEGVLIANASTVQCLIFAVDELSAQFHVFNLQTLIAHFHFPEVPDVASLNAAQYEHQRKRLSEIEDLLAA